MPCQGRFSSEPCEGGVGEAGMSMEKNKCVTCLHSMKEEAEGKVELIGG